MIVLRGVNLGSAWAASAALTPIGVERALLAAPRARRGLYLACLARRRVAILERVGMNI